MTVAKKRVTITIIFCLMMISSTVIASRLITNSSDDIFTKIVSSNGKTWTATANNIQAAINDLNNKTGVIYLPGDQTFYLQSTLKIWRNIILDMGGAELRLPAGICTNVVELKDNSGIKNGVINVAGHQAPVKKSNTSFTVPYAAIYLNASSYIESASIENMHLESISDGYNMTPNEPFYVTANSSGRGYGIHFHATNTSVPQKISGVYVDRVFFRSFRLAIYLNNERNSTTGNGAYLNNNFFHNLVLHSCSWGINFTRVVNNDRCNISYNTIDRGINQAGDGSYWGGEWLTHAVIKIDGRNNYIKNMIVWDFTANHVGDGLHGVYFTDKSSYNYMRIPVVNSNYYNDSGENNTFINCAPFYANTEIISINHVDELGSATSGTLYERFNGPGNANTNFGGTTWLAQTFTVGTSGPNVTHYLNKTILYLNKFGSTPGTIKITIRAVDGTGQPTGTNLSNGTTDGNTLGNVIDVYEARTIMMSNMSLVAGTKYSIVMTALTADATNYIRISLTNPGTYAGGNTLVSWDSGSSWNPLAYDVLFKEYGP